MRRGCIISPAHTNTAQTATAVKLLWDRQNILDQVENAMSIDREQGPDARNLRDTEELVVANQVPVKNRSFGKILSKPAPHWQTSNS